MDESRTHIKASNLCEREYLGGINIEELSEEY